MVAPAVITFVMEAHRVWTYLLTTDATGPVVNLYEAGTRLVVLAAAEPDDLYPAGDGAFEFERTVSRLREMSSASWLEKSAHA